jgi:Tfp pilus assembly PilM family ATPase/Tfp pilus assembly protein PilN
MNRVGIELSASSCRIVAIRGRPSKAGSSASPGETRVDAFHSITCDDPESLTWQLRALLTCKAVSRRAWVTLWGLRSVHRFMLLPPARPEDLEALARREARRDLDALEAQGENTSCGVAVGALRQTPAGDRREALLVAAPAEEVRRRLQPLMDAGFVIEGVVTPGLALASVARACGATPPDATHAYLAIAGDAIVLAVVRDGLLLFVREMPWGHESDIAAESRLSGHLDAFTARLASELRRTFLFLRQSFKADVDRVLVCGDLPELRSMTAPLMEALELEIETLDSMQGIDVTALPEPVEAFREQVAALRLAWGLAADAAPTINLLPADIMAARDARRLRLVLGGGVAAAVAAGAILFWQADATARAREQALHDLQQQVSTAEPRAQAFAQGREQQSFDRVRLAALEALDSQGPRLARVLEVMGYAAPPEIVLKTLSVRPDTASWRLTLGGLAVTGDPALAQAAINRYLRDLQASPYLGAPVRSPSLRMRAGAEPGESTEERAAMPALAPGMSGIDFSVEFEVRK